jgi:DNA-binding IclR family transcriptional regulator
MIDGAANGRDDDGGGSRAVVHGAFAVLGALRRSGPARVSAIARACGLPRTTVHRLLAQLQDVGAVQRSGALWRLGPALVELGATVPAAPGLRAVARRPMADLANASGAHVALGVDMGGRMVTVDVAPGIRPLAWLPEPGTVVSEQIARAGLDAARLAVSRAHARATDHDLRPVIDAGGVHPGISCVAAPLCLGGGDVGVIWAMTPGGAGVPRALVSATRHIAERVAAQLG